MDEVLNSERSVPNFQVTRRDIPFTTIAVRAPNFVMPVCETKRLFQNTKHETMLRPLGSPTSLLFNKYWGHWGGKSSRSVASTHFRLVTRLKMSGAIPLLPPVRLHGVNKDNFYIQYTTNIIQRNIPWHYVMFRTNDILHMRHDILRFNKMSE